ncbi:type I-E CRISPR-associated protein Cse1/CasA [Microbulbifer thermotolerans]|uniref:Type I-E CRISPR-associated protein Cse1/CasA n=1 Tax=Microbulbifer thermotolerans TaxID=252514 RepID=A0A143HJ14_MICTH|nr:type I-E CRISPR-associated protein Cse1/CasA [Microbulbifer thermotolerans]AMX01709.1 type I-E CRISPR-associated protein Cse1/CasA [Microbulbifer thermotolerans]
MNLLIAPWLPFRRRDGSQEYLPVTAMVDPEIIDLALPREDFQGAAYQFLIGLLQTAMAPEDKEEWVRLYQTPPSIDELREVLEKWQPAFELDSAGPAFMQDFDLLEDSKASSIEIILVDSPGDNAKKQNRDFFVKGRSNPKFCKACTAISLYNFNSTGQAIGARYRTGLRGGGPITTVVMPVEKNSSLWEKLWLNVIDIEFLGCEKPSVESSHTFPWMGPTRTSENDEEVLFDQVHPVHMYWAMPQRMRVIFLSEDGLCDICGRRSNELAREVRIKTYGYNYKGDWDHYLTPYGKKNNKPNETSYARKASEDGIGYKYWGVLAFEDSDGSGSVPAKCVTDYYQKVEIADDVGIEMPDVFLIWAFGYDLDKGKTRGWYSSYMPLLALSKEAYPLAKIWLKQMISLTEDSSSSLIKAVKEAWFKNPKEVKGNMGYISASLWETTEHDFYQLLMELGERLSGDAPPQRFPPEIAAHWYRTVTRQAAALFDEFVLSSPLEQLDMKRITRARKNFKKRLHQGTEAKAFRKTGRLDDSGQPQSARAKQGETA